MENEAKGCSSYMPSSLCIFICALKNIHLLILTLLKKLMNLEGKFTQKESSNAVPGSKENVARYKNCKRNRFSCVNFYMKAWWMTVELCTLLIRQKIQARVIISLQFYKNDFLPYHEEQLVKFDLKVVGWKHTQQMCMQ